LKKGDTPPKLGADTSDLSPESRQSSKQGVNALRNPIKNIRRENSLPPETTDLSFDETEPFKSFVENKHDQSPVTERVRRPEKKQANLNDSFSTCEV
jgi:hypothetical protein